MNTRTVGGQEEDRAADYLATRGYKIISRNLHFRFGEIDILAEDKHCIVIVEVKAKKSSLRGAAVEMVTPAKKRTLRLLAKLLQTRYNKPVRVDVITIDNAARSDAEIRHYPYAIEE